MTQLYDVLRRPIITEKSNFQSGQLNQYTFEVADSATKAQIKEAVETIFNVDVIRVNVLRSPAKRSRRARSRRLLVRKAAVKKAIVMLAAGNSIDVFEGVQ
jgi:large subunit ribosomal protein L23